MKNNILCPSDNACTGCGACSAACPCSAIDMQLNTEGFFSPVVDDDKCIDCGLCQKVCYKFFTPSETMPRITENVYGMYATDNEVRQSATSGGFAHELSLWGLRSGYKIFGVIYDYETHRAKSILTDKEEDLQVLRGSKYLQSETQEALETLIADAKANPDAKYICVGTPCQILGLRLLLKQKRITNECILIDLFCHGVPSYLVWQPYLKNQTHRIGELRKVNFRDKVNGWHQYTIHLSGEKKEYTQYAYKDLFYGYFFDNVALNTACFTCKVRKQISAADVRIGDFLGGAYEHCDDGISAVMPLTQKGYEVLRVLQSSGRMIANRKWNAEACIRSQSTHDYSGLELRNQVIEALCAGKGLRAVRKWYLKQFPLSYRLRIALKKIITLLPNGPISKMRRAFRLLVRRQ